MRQLLRALVRGQALRHRPVALQPVEQQSVRATVVSPDGERDVTATLFPVSRDPLLLGLAREAGEPAAGRATIRMRDGTSGDLLGSLDAVPAGVFEHPGGAVDLLRPIASSVSCVSAAERAWRYALGWRHARLNARRSRAFAMSFADLRALNVLYIPPRPLYLVSVVHEGAGNVFAIDLVATLGEQGFLLALRLTTPSVEDLRASGRIAVSAVPAAWKAMLHPLGDHHYKRAIDWARCRSRSRPRRRLAFPCRSARSTCASSRSRDARPSDRTCCSRLRS